MKRKPPHNPSFLKSPPVVSGLALLAMIPILCLCAGAFAQGPAAVQPHPDWTNTLQPKGVPGPELTLATNGATDYVILLPAQPTTQEEKAAADLALWLHQMTGTEFPIVNETDSPVSPKAISIGQTTLLSASDLSGASDNPNPSDRSDPTDQSDSSAPLAPEAYAIHVKDQTLFLQGGDTRGIINAVYALLEEDLGCRWYHRDSTTIPHRPDLTFRPVPRTFAPVLEIRDPFYWDAFHVDWSLRNRTNAPTVKVPEEWGGRMYYASGYFVHTYNRLVPPSKYFEEHPEYYSLLNGKRVARQLCVTNPDVIRIATQQALEDLRKDPNGHLMSISPNDGTGYCECETCMALDNAEGTRAASALQFVNAIADAIKDEFPRTKISTLAYLDTIKPPTKDIRPRENVVMRICTDRHAWSQCFEFLTETQECQTALKDWADIGAKIHVWDYTVNFSHCPIPMPNMPIVSQNIRFLINHNAKGIMLQGAYQSPGAARGPLRSWVWAKQLWDPSLNTRELMRDFTYGFYGEAAEPMQAYNELLWQLWEREHMGLLRGDTGNIRYPPTSAFLSKSFLDDASALFAEAESLADNPETLRRVKLAKLSILYVKVAQGPDRTDEDYTALLDELEAIGRAEKVTQFYEGQPNFEERIAHWRGIATSHGTEVSTLDLPREWFFQADPNNVGEREQWYAPDLADLGWNRLKCDTGHGWDDQGFKDYTGYAWYRVRFDVPASYKDAPNLRLFFGAVDEDCVIYLNGQKAFEHTCESTGYVPAMIWNKPFAFDPTPFIKFGDENHLAVRVFNRLGMGGIWKPVRLITSEKEVDPAYVEELLKEK